MMNLLSLKITGILLGGWLFLWTGGGQAFVSPQHYERIKLQNKQKTRESEKVQPRELVKIQIHQPSLDQSPAGKAGLKKTY
jgi:hypothetical protein